MDFNDVLNTITSLWPLFICVMVAVLCGSMWLAEGGSEKVYKRVPGTKSYKDYRFFREHGYWPGTPDPYGQNEAWQEDYELRSEDEEGR